MDSPRRATGSYREARSRALEARAHRPALPEELAELVARLRRYNETAAIRECLSWLPPLERIRIPLLLFFAAQLGFLNQPEQALGFLDEARRADPDFPPTLAARGQALIWLGRFAEAEKELTRCIHRAPELAQPHWLLARLRRWSTGEHHLQRLRAEFARPGRSADDLAMLGYALHKELDDLEQHGEAWEALAAACRARRSRIEFDAGEARALFEGLMALPPLPPADDQPPVPVPVFIVGMHRSGTTLLEQLLAGHSQVAAMGELYDFTAQLRAAADHHCRGALDATIVSRAPGFDYAAIGRGYLASIAWRSGGRPFCVDKLPSNFLNLAFIGAALPRARVLHVVRDPVDTCFSALREYFSADACPFSYDQRELAGYYRLYQRLMAHWHECLPGRILDVSYESLVDDTEMTLRRVASHCGFDYEPAMLQTAASARGVATASAVQVRGTRERRSALWRPYEASLQPLLQGLAMPRATSG